MGTQQILLIVLSVIIVGAAVAVGIQMFQAQATNSARTAVMSDMNNIASMLVAYFKTPTSLGGAGLTTANATKANMEAYLGTDMLSNDNGTYTINADAAVGNVVTIISTPSEPGLSGVYPTITVDLDDGTIVASPNSTTAPTA